MFNLFRRQREAEEETEVAEKRLDDDKDVSNLVRSESTLSVDSVNRKRVTWAAEMEQVKLLHIDNHSDSSDSQGSSSEDEEEDRNCVEEEGSDVESDQGSSHEDSDSDVNEGQETDDDEDDDDEKDEAHQSTKQETAENKDSNQIQLLKHEMDLLSKDLTAKTTLIDRLQFELREAHEEAELSKYKMSNLQLELEETKHNLEMASSNQSETESDDEAERAAREEKLKEAESRISQLEQQLRQVVAEKEQLEATLQQHTTDRDTRLADLQKAYEEALREQDEIIAKFEEDFEELRTVNSRREQQLLDDFEWKLREVEKNCKARLEKRDNEKERRIGDLIAKLSDSSQQLQEAKRAEEVCKLEVDQAHARNTELQRNLRTTTRKLEEVQVSEKVLQEEATRLRTQLDKEKSFVASLQVVHREELDERERKMNFRLDSQKNLINSEWEERLKRESRQIKQDMERKAKEETDSAVQLVRKQMERTIVTIRAEHEIRTKQLQSQIEEIRKRMVEEEEDHKEALELAQTNTDSQLLELRRKMEKVYMSYEEKIEKLNEQHEQQISRIQEECERRIEKTESNITMHSGTGRTTVDLVQEQLNRDHQTKLQKLEAQHQRQIEEERNRLRREKEEALKAQEAKHREVVKHLQLGLIAGHNSTSDQKDSVDLGVGSNLAMTPQPPVQTSTRELNNAEADLLKEKERLADLTLKAEMCRTIQQLTLQLEASKKEIEGLNSRLNSRSSSGTPTVSEAIRPLAKEPPAPPPRTRGRHHAAADSSIPTAKVQPQNYIASQDDNRAPTETFKTQETTSTTGTQGDNQGAQPRIQAGQQSRRSRKNRSRRH